MYMCCYAYIVQRFEQPTAELVYHIHIINPKRETFSKWNFVYLHQYLAYFVEKEVLKWLIQWKYFFL